MGVLKGQFAARARDLRSRQTDAELRMWSRLRNRQLFGFKFVRQEQVGPFFADFACREANLVVELDGGQHSLSTSDERRTQFLQEHGYRVLRFWNNDVLLNTEGVLQVIADTLSTASTVGRFEGREDRQ